MINHGADDAELRLVGTDVLTGASASGMALPPQGVAVISASAPGSEPAREDGATG